MMSKTLPNGVSTNYEYDGMSRLTRLKDVNTSVPLFDRQYSYNTANQISQIVDISTTKTFGYDNIDRLTSVTDAVNGNESYAFDAVGNRISSHLSTSYTYQPFNRMTATQTATLDYDPNGNMTSKAEGSQFWRFNWDHENRLTQVATRKQSVRYSFDALGRRVQRYVRGGSDNTKFIYDGPDVIVDDDSGTLTKYQNGPGIDNKLSARQGSTTNYFLADHLGSTNGTADATGAVTSQTSYDSFGTQTSSLSTRYGFTGREHDSFSGLMYYRARFYDPKLGRFISEDPIGFGGGINQFAYLSNGPINKTDPLGLYEIDVHYYLTLYLALRSGCYSQGQAVAIANGNQLTDETDDASPGFNRRYQNSTYHALNSNASPGQPSQHLQAMANNPQIDFLAFGRSLHYLQDTYSHTGFSSNVYGHARVGHYFDKTNSDTIRAMRMAMSTWNALSEFGGRQGCECRQDLTHDELNTIAEFVSAPGSDYPTLNTIDSTGENALDGLWANPGSYLDRKRAILGVLPR
jgi:RHS repeat-associated protein